MYNDPMMASVLYRLEAEEAEQTIERRRVALEHPGMIRRPSPVSYTHLTLPTILLG